MSDSAGGELWSVRVQARRCLWQYISSRHQSRFKDAFIDLFVDLFLCNKK